MHFLQPFFITFKPLLPIYIQVKRKKTLPVLQNKAKLYIKFDK